MQPRIIEHTAKNGTVTYRFRVTTTLGVGSRKEIQKTGFRTKRDAERAMTKLLSERDNTGTVAGSAAGKTTVAAFLERWSAGLNRAEPRGAQLFEMAKYLIPRTQNDRFKTFGPVRVGELYVDIRTHGRVHGDKPLSDTTMTHVAKTLNIAMTTAVKEGLLAKNPCADVDDKPRTRRREMKAWRVEDTAAFVAAAADADLYFAWLLMLLRGMRPSEVAGLRSGDFHVDQRVLSIQRGWVLVGTKPYISDGKSFHSARTISLDDLLLAEYHRYMLRRYEWRQAAGDEWIESDWLFVWPTSGGHGQGRGKPHHAGEPYNPRVIRDRFMSLCERAGLPPIREYDLRHTAATLALLNGTNVKIVAEMLGNDPAVTMRTYQHVTENMHAQAGADLTAVIFGAGWEAEIKAAMAQDES